MNFCLAVFRSRTQVLEFIDGMKARGIPCGAVNTPARAHIGCGISAKFDLGRLPYAREVIYLDGLNTFNGFYRVEQIGFRTTVTKI